MAQSTSIPTSIESASPTSTASLSFPSCARSCLANATSSLPCKETDTQCLCLHASAVQSSVSACLTASGSCSAADKTTATLFYNNLCESLGYPTEAAGSSLPTAALVTATGSPSAVQTTAAPTSQISRAPAQKSSSSHSRSLSVPTIAGIAAGIAFLAIAIITVLVFLYIRRRSQEDIVIVDSEKHSKPSKSTRVGTSQRSRSRPRSSRRSALFTLEGPSPPRKDGVKPSVYEKEVTSTSTFDNRPTLTNNSYTWYNKKAAELSTTSLMSVPRNAHTPVPKSPTRTVFSDQASIYSVTSSEVSAVSSRPPSGVPQPPSPISKSQTRVVVSQHIFNAPNMSFSQSRPSTSHSTVEKLPPLTTAKVPTHEESEFDDGRFDRRISFNPSGQNPSARPNRDSASFNFELPNQAYPQELGNNFMATNELDRWRERK